MLSAASTPAQATMTKSRLAELLTPERIMPELNASGAPAVLRAMARLVAEEAGSSEAAVLDAIRKMERLTSFGVGRGVAVPHAVLDGIPAPIGAFAHLRHLVDFEAADGRLVDLVFLLLVPKAEAKLLLPLLAGVVRRLRDREVLKHLRSGSSAAASFSVLTTDSWRGAGQPTGISLRLA
jgi:PTS system nitrogen regulatory IIA component